MLKRILHFINVGIWEIHLKNLPPTKALPIKVLACGHPGSAGIHEERLPEESIGFDLLLIAQHGSHYRGHLRSRQGFWL